MDDKKQYQADVVIVGGGIAGIVTALELLEYKRNVLIIDRDEQSAFGGLANWSYGIIHYVNTAHQRKAGIQDSVELGLQDWLRHAQFDEGDVWPRRWAEFYVQRSKELSYHWLQELGIEFISPPVWMERGLDDPGNSLPRAHMVWGTGYHLTQTLIRRLRRHRNAGRLQFCFRHRVTELIKEGEAIVGVRGENEETAEPFTATADAIVIAAGGLTGNVERLKADFDKELGTPPPTILIGTHPYSRGDLHDAAASAGALLSHTARTWYYVAGIHHPKPRFEGHGLSLIPWRSALHIDAQGNRAGPSPLANLYDLRRAVQWSCQSEQPYTWALLNKSIAYTEMAISGSEHNPALRDRSKLRLLWQALRGNRSMVDEFMKECKDFVVANSLPELVEKMAELAGDGLLEADRVRELVKRYDAMIARGERFWCDAQLRRITELRRDKFMRARIAKSQKIVERGSMPLIAVRQFLLARKSLGGIQTNLQSQVLKADGNPIIGLYAVGEAAGYGGGGMHGRRALEGTFLGGCILTARVAAEQINKAL